MLSLESARQSSLSHGVGFRGVSVLGCHADCAEVRSLCVRGRVLVGFETNYKGSKHVISGILA